MKILNLNILNVMSDVQHLLKIGHRMFFKSMYVTCLVHSLWHIGEVKSVGMRPSGRRLGY